MAVYSVNQATQFYVVAAAPTVKTTKDGKAKIVGLGANSDLATDLIDKKKVLSVTTVSSDDMGVKAIEPKITIKSASAGTYVMRVVIKNYFSESPSGVYIKHASAYIPSGKQVKDVADALAASLNLGLKRDLEPAFSVTNSGTGVLTLTPIATEWVLGRKSTTIPELSVELVPMDPMETEASWATVEYLEATPDAPNRNLVNEKLADYEYFCLGERGDIYRGANWPNNIETKGEINQTDEYTVVTVHYYEDLTNEAVQKSEKTAVFACTSEEIATAVAGAFTHPIEDLEKRVDELEQ